ncbi:radical SAM protein [Desulfobacter hydrogenophilus]|uniref:Radical SAM protein n=1 Tax=Desulfobacter hydrogenophilus TaxID=2291 RepID=A0A328FIP3_9BACT|nr:radical SAM protein [Desulfobacter hydrogenophilus]NDY70962.1 radical SAM protein [Desulfobacter hydrogenophilus]QBH12796.1 radical SAM protein [Desulfobacter hydrogenophilus]RAM03033.1 radical SAM protein [Desulfobacter hydrogenophilus]
MAAFQPAYVKTKAKGLLRDKISEARHRLKSCELCPRACKADRLSGELGECSTGEEAVVSSFNAHFGEESPLVGAFGSGTIFFSHCNLKCNFCQNYEISHEGSGEECGRGQLAGMMLILQNNGCHNINFVTPTHVVPQILSALDMAIDGGLSIPLVYNSSGYDKVETLKLLEGIIDIYMPDFKFWDPAIAEQTCNAPDYPDVAAKAVAEMHRQVGDLQFDENGIATRGLLLRHLVMPSGMAGTGKVMSFIANHVSKNTYVNIMDQYRPCGKAHHVKGLEKSVSETEFNKAVQEAKDAGISRFAAL